MLDVLKMLGKIQGLCISVQITVRTECEILISLCFVEENIYVMLPFSFRFKTLCVAVNTRQKSKL